MKDFTRLIGKEFKYGPYMLRVVKDEYPYCTDCFFQGNVCWGRNPDMTCGCAPGITGNCIKFVEVEEGEEGGVE